MIKHPFANVQVLVDIGANIVALDLIGGNANDEIIQNGDGEEERLSKGVIAMKSCSLFHVQRAHKHPARVGSSITSSPEVAIARRIDRIVRESDKKKRSS